jgi:hypothetical protein
MSKGAFRKLSSLFFKSIHPRSKTNLSTTSFLPDLCAKSLVLQGVLRLILWPCDLSSQPSESPWPLIQPWTLGEELENLRQTFTTKTSISSRSTITKSTGQTSFGSTFVPISLPRPLLQLLRRLRSRISKKTCHPKVKSKPEVSVFSYFLEVCFILLSFIIVLFL